MVKRKKTKGARHLIAEAEKIMTEKRSEAGDKLWGMAQGAAEGSSRQKKSPAGAGLRRKAASSAIPGYRPIAKGSTSREPHFEHRHRFHRSETSVHG